MMNEQIKRTMPIELLRLEPCFIRLTERQKLMIETYITSGADKTLSVLTAYHVKDRETARKMSYESFSRPGVIQVLNAYWGVTPFEAFKQDVERAVRNKSLSVAQIRALELQARLNGWSSTNLPNLHGHDEPDAESKIETTATSEVSPERFQVGDICFQDGQKYRVTSIDANGQPLTADEVQ